MNNIMYTLFLSIFISVNLNAIEVEALAQKLNLSAGSKAIVQWKRVFKSERKMKRYKIDTLSNEQKIALEEYLKNHAIDSDKPTVAGRF